MLVCSRKRSQTYLRRDEGGGSSKARDGLTVHSEGKKRGAVLPVTATAALASILVTATFAEEANKTYVKYKE